MQKRPPATDPAAELCELDIFRCLYSTAYPPVLTEIVATR